MINYQTLPGLAEHLEQNGYRVIKRDGVFVGYDSDGNSSDLIDSAINALISAYDPIDFVKVEKGDEIKQEALARVNSIFPSISSLDELKLEQERWLSLAPVGIQPTPDYQKAIDIYVAAINAVAQNAAETDWLIVSAYDVNTGPSWPL
jgi:hypothetical protein